MWSYFLETSIDCPMTSLNEVRGFLVFFNVNIIMFVMIASSTKVGLLG